MSIYLQVSIALKSIEVTPRFLELMPQIAEGLGSFGWSLDALYSANTGPIHHYFAIWKLHDANALPKLSSDLRGNPPLMAKYLELLSCIAHEELTLLTRVLPTP